MGVTFNEIPLGTKVPFVFVEFDTSKAQQGASIQEYFSLLIGQKLSTGTATVNELIRISSDSQARKLFGAGSMLFHMAKAYLAENKINALTCVCLDDDGAGVKAAGNIQFGGAGIKAGTVSTMLGGRRYRAGHAEDETPADAVIALVPIINADIDRHFDASINGGDPAKMDLEYRHKGLVGNEVDIRLNFFSDEALPENMTAVPTQPTGGTSNPDISTVIAAIADEQFHTIAMPYSDSANLSALQTELEDRFGPSNPIDGHGFYPRRENFGSHISFLDTRNTAQETVIDVAGPTSGFEWVANESAVVAREGQKAPARPFQTVELTQILPPAKSELFENGERDQILKAGGSTYRVDSGGNVLIERLRTTKIEDSLGSPDESLADLNPKLILSFLRFDFRNLFLRKYPRHQLADDGTRFAEGIKIITPKTGKAEAVQLFEQWEELGLVEGADQFENDLIVERNPQDPTRLDFLLSPDLVNQLRIVGTQIAFLL